MCASKHYVQLHISKKHHIQHLTLPAWLLAPWHSAMYTGGYYCCELSRKAFIAHSASLLHYSILSSHFTVPQAIHIYSICLHNGTYTTPSGNTASNTHIKNISSQLTTGQINYKQITSRLKEHHTYLGRLLLITHSLHDLASDRKHFVQGWCGHTPINDTWTCLAGQNNHSPTSWLSDYDSLKDA